MIRAETLSLHSAEFQEQIAERSSLASLAGLGGQVQEKQSEYEAQDLDSQSTRIYKAWPDPSSNLSKLASPGRQRCNSLCPETSIPLL